MILEKIEDLTYIKKTTHSGSYFLKYYKINKDQVLEFTCVSCRKASTTKAKILYKNKKLNCSRCNLEISILKKYGVNNVFKSKEIRSKIEETCKERYGFSNPNKSDLIKNKVRETQYENNKGVFAFNSQKQKETNLKRYGFESALKSKTIREKINKTVLNKYGVFNVLQYNSFREKMIFKKNIEAFNRISSLIFSIPLFNLEDWQNKKDKYQLFKWKCKKCQREFEDYYENGVEPRCCHCFPKLNGSSLLEKEVVEYIKSLNIEIEENNRKIIKPLELDIYVQSKKLAIEFNGTYWHSSAQKDKWYHQIKIELCKRLDIRLIHIYEWEWVNNKQICIDKINYYLKNDDKIDIRKPEAVLVQNNKETKWDLLNKENSYNVIFI